MAITDAAPRLAARLDQHTGACAERPGTLVAPLDGAQLLWDGRWLAIAFEDGSRLLLRTRLGDGPPELAFEGRSYDWTNRS